MDKPTETPKEDILKGDEKKSLSDEVQKKLQQEMNTFREFIFRMNRKQRRNYERQIKAKLPGISKEQNENFQKTIGVKE